MANRKGKTTRSFYYYDLLLMKNQNSKYIKIEDQEKSFYDIFKTIKGKQDKIKNGVSKSEELEVSIDNGDKIYVIVDRIEDNCPIEFRLVLCRANALPLVENNGLLNFLTDYLPKDFTLAEITHCIIFPKYNIMGAEYNFSGARATAIKAYLPIIYPKVDHVYCANKIDEKVIDKLKKGETFSLFSLSIKNDSEAMSELMNKRSIFQLPFVNIPDVDVFEITLKRRKSKLHEGFDSPIPIDEIDNFIRDYREDIRGFKVSQGTIQNDCIDLLYDKLVKVCEVTKTVNKTIDSKAAYRIIEDFFNSTVRPLARIKNTGD